MLAFIATRLANAVLIMIVVAFVAFSLLNFVGDPVSNMLGDQAPQQQKAELRAVLGLDQPIYIQFGRFIWRATHGDFGMSYRNLEPVSGVLLSRLPATLELSACAVLLALLIGIPAGVYTGLHRNSWLSQIIQTTSLIGVSLPSFLTGIVLILVFSVELKWLGSYGRGETVAIGWWTTGLLTRSGLAALILPSITLSLFQTTLIMRLIRAEMLEVLRTDYIKFARARGLTRRTINFGHALKNTLVPVITIIGLQFGSIIAFAIITETVFQWPGMGSLTIQAITFGDMPVLSAYLVLVSLMFVMINLVVDILYYFVDPRIRAERVGAMG